MRIVLAGDTHMHRSWCETVAKIAGRLGCVWVAQVGQVASWSMTRFGAPEIAAPLGSVETDRLILRRFEATDLDGLADVFANREVWEFPYGRAFTQTETSRFLDAQIQEWDECGFGCWIAVLRETHQTIGYVGLSVPMFLPEILPAVEVGWRFDPAYWGKGLASEGARAALREGFTTLGLSEICSLPQSTNPPSFNLCERIGMTYRRSIDCPPTDRRGAVEARMYVMSADEWREPWAERREEPRRQRR